MSLSHRSLARLCANWWGNGHWPSVKVHSVTGTSVFRPSVLSVIALHKDPSKKLLFVFMCWKGHPRTVLLCKEHLELWSQIWFVGMSLGMWLKSCIIMIYISFPLFFLITALILVNINLYFTWKMKKCSIFYTGNSNIRTIPVENRFINHTSI